MISKKISWVFPTVAASAIAFALGPTVVSCSSPSCESLSNCATDIPPGGSSGEAGAQDGAGTSGGGTSGNSGASGGGAAGHLGGGSSGEPGGDSGAGGTAASKPCDSACSGAKPVCDESAEVCVQCLESQDCTGADKVCNPASKACVQCLLSEDCNGSKKVCDSAATTCVECLKSKDCTGANKVCDTPAKACVACLDSTDCSDPKAAKCDAKSCTKCTSNDDCVHLAEKTVCDTKAGECVQCTGTDYAACGQSMGTQLVCDTLKRTCSSNKEKSTGLCQSCVSDAQCSAGKLCVKESFGTPSQDVGYFCFWKKGDTANGAPSTCLPGADPYAKTLINQSSIDGTTADVCGLRSSTCVARNQNSTKDCATSGVADDQKCGFAPGKDSKCSQPDVGVFRCTMICISDDDCPGTACDLGSSPSVCAL